MQTILEYGMLISFDDSNKYAEAKRRINVIGGQIEKTFPGKSGMHAITLADKNLLLSCHLSNGVVRFAIFHVKERELCRECSPDTILKIGERAWGDLVNRLENSINKKLILTPLGELWELSIQKELSFTDMNGIVELKDEMILNVSVEELSGRENIEK